MNAIGPAKTAAFKKWLIQQGADIYHETNEYEIARFSCSFGIGVVYKNKNGYLSFSCSKTRDTYLSWRNCTAWKYKYNRTQYRHKAKGKRGEILKRDGCSCFYCGLDYEPAELTIEHLISLTYNGPDNLCNLVMACDYCNKLAGNIPLIDKIKLREKMQGMTNEQSKTNDKRIAARDHESVAEHPAT